MTICSSGRELCSGSDVVILGVKPQVIEGVLSEIAGACTSDKLIISMAAGVAPGVPGGAPGSRDTDHPDHAQYAGQGGGSDDRCMPE